MSIITKITKNINKTNYKKYCIMKKKSNSIILKETASIATFNVGILTTMYLFIVKNNNNENNKN